MNKDSLSMHLFFSQRSFRRLAASVSCRERGMKEGVERSEMMERRVFHLVRKYCDRGVNGIRKSGKESEK